ncbi:MAG: hypothetical protein WAN20_08010 [Pseudonocardiaceae bacterium]
MGPRTVLIEVGEDPLTQHGELPGIQGAGVVSQLGFDLGTGVVTEVWGKAGQDRADRLDVRGTDRVFSHGDGGGGECRVSQCCRGPRGIDFGDHGQHLRPGRMQPGFQRGQLGDQCGITVLPHRRRRHDPILQ